jgi:hypothetical protein
VILAIPPAILAIMDIADRMKLVKRFDAMLGEMRTLLGNGKGVIRIGARRTFDIASAKAREIIDAIRTEDGD